jgi:hypothetical protein
MQSNTGYHPIITVQSTATTANYAHVLVAMYLSGLCVINDLSILQRPTYKFLKKKIPKYTTPLVLFYFSNFFNRSTPPNGLALFKSF